MCVCVCVYLGAGLYSGGAPWPTLLELFGPSFSFSVKTQFVSVVTRCLNVSAHSVCLVWRSSDFYCWCKLTGLLLIIQSERSIPIKMSESACVFKLDSAVLQTLWVHSGGAEVVQSGPEDHLCSLTAGAADITWLHWFNVDPVDPVDPVDHVDLWRSRLSRASLYYCIFSSVLQQLIWTWWQWTYHSMTEVRQTHCGPLCNHGDSQVPVCDLVSLL